MSRCANKSSWSEATCTCCRASTSRLLAESCDEFIFYNSILRRAKPEQARPAAQSSKSDLSKTEAFALLIETIEGVQKDQTGPVSSGVLKQSMMRKAPTFDEGDYNFSSFKRFLEGARNRNMVIFSAQGVASSPVLRAIGARRRAGERGVKCL